MTPSASEPSEEETKPRIPIQVPGFMLPGFLFGGPAVAQELETDEEGPGDV